MKMDFRKRAVSLAVVASMIFPDGYSALSPASWAEGQDEDIVSDASSEILTDEEMSGKNETEADGEPDKNSETGTEEQEGSGYGEGFINAYVEPEYHGDFVPDTIIDDDDFPDQYISPIVQDENDPQFTDHRFVTSVKNQGRDGVCWSFAAIADYEAALLTFLGTPFTGDSQLDLSESHLRYAVSADGGNIYSGSSRHFDGGGNWKDALKYFTRSLCGGPLNETDDPFSDSAVSRPAAVTLSLSEKRIPYYPVKMDSIGTLDKSNADFNAVKSAVKKSVYESGAAECSYYSDQNKYRFSDIGEVYYNTRSDSNHAVTIVGWDDNVPASYFGSTPPGKGAWLVKNSWGTDGGDKPNDGYFWMSYYTPCKVESIEKIRDFDFTKEKIYEYDNLGVTSYTGYNKNSFGYVKYSTGNSSETLKSLGFSTTGNTQAYYRFYVSADGSPDNFKEVKIDNGSLGLGDYTEKGYYIPGNWDWFVFDLAEPVEVNGDFLAGYSVYKDNSSAWLGVAKASSGSGRSFISTSFEKRSSATDLISSNAVLALKAYTSSMRDAEFSGVSGSLTCKFDYNDRDSAERDCTSDITVTVSSNPDMVGLYANGFTFSSDSTEYRYAEKLKVSSVDYTKSTGSAPARLKIRAEKGAVSGNYYLAYKGKIISSSPVVYTASEAAIDTKISGSSVGYSGSNPVISLRNSYGATAVSSVAAEGFKDNTHIREVTVPEGYTSVGSKAFSGCTGLEKVYLPDSVISIAPDAFDGCNTSGLVIICSDTVSGKLPAGIQSFSSDTGADGGISVMAGQTLTVDYITKQVKMNGKLTGFITGTDNYDRNQLTDLKWVLETADGKVSQLAKFRNAAKTGTVYDLTSLKSRVTAEIGGLKSDGLFTGTAVLKVVSAADSKKIYASCTMRIKPTQVTELKVKLPSGTSSPIVQNADGTYTLTLNEGSSFKLPVYAADGQNKNLIYSTESGDFTVINGVVRGISQSSAGIITVYPQDQGMEFDSPVRIRVNVVKPQGKAVLTADKKSLSLTGADKRSLTVTNIGSSNEVTFAFKNGGTDTDAYSIDGAALDKTTFTGSKTFKIYVHNNSLVKAGDYLEISANGKTVKVGLSVSNTYQNVSKINEPNAKKLTDGAAEINIAQGQSFNLGVSVLPAAADDKITWKVYKDKECLETSDIVSVSENTVTAKTEGVCYVKGQIACGDMSDTVLSTQIYRVNVYKTGGSIVWKDNSYAVTGGFLMTSEDAEGACTKQICGGRIINLAAPVTAGNSEEIIWTSSNPAALSIDFSVSGRLKLALVQPGTFTVTGTSKYTKQKFVFKVNITESETVAGKADDHVEYCLSGQNSWTASGTGAADGHSSDAALKLKTGTTASLRFVTSENCAAVTYTSSESKSVSIDQKGNLKVLKAAAAPVKITVKMTHKDNAANNISRDFWVVPEAPDDVVTITPKFQTSAQAGTEITLKATVKGVSGPVTWSRVRNTGFSDSGEAFASETSDVTVEGGKLKLNIPKVWPDGDKYEVKVKAAAGGYTEEFTVTVYKTLATSVTVHPEDAVRVKRYGTAGKGITSTLNESSEDNYHRIIVDLYAGGSQTLTQTDASGRTVQKKVAADATSDEITWVSSNTYLATAESAAHVSGHCDKEDPYGQSLVITANNRGYSGTVIFTGTFKNSGRKVSVKVNILPPKNS